MSPDVVVVGAGVFGAWTAWHLQRSGRQVLLLDAYGVATARASSGGETRLIRAGYGRDAVYTRAAMRSLGMWQHLEARTGVRIFEPSGVLSIGHGSEAQTEATWDTLRACGVRAERLTRAALVSRFASFSFADDAWGVFEPDAGVLHARRGVRTVVEEATRLGVELSVDAARPAEEPVLWTGRIRRLEAIDTMQGRRIAAGAFVFAAGSWLPKLLPAAAGARIFPTRQEVFFFGAPAGDRRYTSAALPAWIDFRGGVYGHGDIAGRGVKIAVDRHGPPIDPDTADRHVAAAAVAALRDELGARLPGLGAAPLLEARVCQYENSANGDFLIDRHPQFDNVWIAGGGSGHGFKHGPFVGEYVAGLMRGTTEPEPRFALVTKATTQARTVY